MRIDKYLKNARIIKRRTVAKEACDAGRVFLNDKEAKAGSEVKEGDVLRICFGSGELCVRVLEVREVVRKEEAAALYEVISQQA